MLQHLLGVSFLQLVIVAAVIGAVIVFVRSPSGMIDAAMAHKREVGIVLGVLLVGYLVLSLWAVLTTLVTVGLLVGAGSWYWIRGRHMSLAEIRYHATGAFQRPVNEKDAKDFEKSWSVLPDDHPDAKR